MKAIPRIFRNERRRFVILALLLFLNSVVVQSNGVVATSGFVSRVGLSEIVIVWGFDNLIIFFSSGLYSLIVDRVKRSRLAIGLLGMAVVIYVLLYGLFKAGVPDEASYTVLMILNDQQWILFPLMIWALANDVFSITEGKRLFPWLGLAAFLGGIAGNGLAAGITRLTGTSYDLMLLNAAMMGTSALVLIWSLRHIPITARQARTPDRTSDILREGLSFVRSIPAFRYLTLATLLVGIGLNTIEYQLIVDSLHTYPNTADLQAFYGTFRMIRMISLLVVQGALAGWLINRIGFKSIFVLLPIMMASGLLAPVLLSGLIVIAAGEYLSRLVMEGIDDPARRAFLGLVPDEQRGRVSAFLGGYLYPAGAVISCLLIGLAVLAASVGVISERLSEVIYLSLSGIASVVAIWLVIRFRATYDQSMLNWRLKRRPRKSMLSDIEF